MFKCIDVQYRLLKQRHFLQHTVCSYNNNNNNNELLQVVIPRGALKAKGLLLACVRDPNPCIFFEPKIMYRIAVDDVPDDDYEFPLGKADVLVEGKDVTLIGWGTQVHVLLEVAEIANKDFGISCEVIDLVSILPWDKQTVSDVCSENNFCLLHLV